MADDIAEVLGDADYLIDRFLLKIEVVFAKVGVGLSPLGAVRMAVFADVLVATRDFDLDNQNRSMQKN